MSQSIAANTHRFQPITAEYSLSESEVGAPIAIMGVPFDNVTRAQTLAISVIASLALLLFLHEFLG